MHKSQIQAPWVRTMHSGFQTFISITLIFMMLLTSSKLTIVMEDEKENGEKDLIDEFTIVLSLSGEYNLTLTGKEQLATMALSYQIHCTNLPDCPTPSLSPTSK